MCTHWGHIPKLSLVMVMTPRSLEPAVSTDACSRRNRRASPGQSRHRRAHGGVGKYLLCGLSPRPSKALVICLGHCWSLPLSLVRAISLPLLSLLYSLTVFRSPLLKSRHILAVLVSHARNPSTQATKAGGPLRVRDQPGLQREILNQHKTGSEIYVNSSSPH